MFFGSLPIEQVEGCLLVHSLKIEGLSLKKGCLLSEEDIVRLRDKGIVRLVVARLDQDDVHEDPAAQSIANIVAGSGIFVDSAFAGCVNLIAESRGLLIIDSQRLLSLNTIDESITIATLPNYIQVEKNQLVATVKIIPFAISKDKLHRCFDIASKDRALLQTAPFQSRPVGLIQTQLSEERHNIFDTTKRVLDVRLQALDCSVSVEIRCQHQVTAVAEAIAQVRAEGVQLVVISGASAIMDRRDVVPAGIIAAGGVIDHFGIPVDPGNLLLIAHCDNTTILGMPGCARSPKLNGFDWILQRLIANQPIGSEQIMAMGIGGLLKDISG